MPMKFTGSIRKMSPQAVADSPIRAVDPETTPELRFVARQPILDLRGRVHGYELLFRNGAVSAFSGNGDFATRAMIDNAVVFGFDRLTGGLPAFVNCTAESLLDDLVDVLPSGGTVLEILENLEPTPRLIHACRELKARGFRIALDDFVWEPRFEPLVELADYIKVDFLLTPPDQRRQLFKRTQGKKIAMLAEKVETEDNYRSARSEGFTLFQGYYFCRPQLIKSRTVPANQLMYLEILRQLRAEFIDFQQLCTAVKRDTSLTFRLMRLVNSAAYAMQQEVKSVKGAIMVLGEDTFRRIAMLAIATAMNSGRPSEILRMALIRARFCELAAALCSLCPAEQYLLGMFSLLPAMLRMPMESVTPMLPVRDAIRQSLEGADLPERVLLGWLEKHEQTDWPACESAARSLSLDPEQLFDAYREAILWAEAALNSAS